MTCSTVLKWIGSTWRSRSRSFRTRRSQGRCCQALLWRAACAGVVESAARSLTMPLLTAASAVRNRHRPARGVGQHGVQVSRQYMSALIRKGCRRHSSRKGRLSRSINSTGNLGLCCARLTAKSAFHPRAERGTVRHSVDFSRRGAIGYAQPRRSRTGTDRPRPVGAGDENAGL